MLLGVRLWAWILILLITESITQQKSAHLQFNTQSWSIGAASITPAPAAAGACSQDHPCRICLTSVQISSFSVSPNYELLFFSSEISEVVNILDFFDGQPVDLKGKLKRFEVTGGSSIWEMHWNKQGWRCSVFTCVCTTTAEHTGTDLNLAFRTILERMALIKQRVGEKTFEEHRHAILVFTDGGSSFVTWAFKGNDFSDFMFPC